MANKATDKSSALEDLPLYLPRLYYAFLGMVERRLAASGLDKHLGPGMGHILFALYEEDDCIIKDISQRVQITYATLTGLLKKMEKAGLIECYRCPEDGRATRVRLTKLGRSLEPKLRDFHEGVTQTLQRGMDCKEIEAAHELFSRLLHNMKLDEEKCRTKAGK